MIGVCQVEERHKQMHTHTCIRTCTVHVGNVITFLYTVLSVLNLYPPTNQVPAIPGHRCSQTRLQMGNKQFYLHDPNHGDKIPNKYQSHEPLATISYCVRINSRCSSIMESAWSALINFLVIFDRLKQGGAGDLLSWNREESIGDLGHDQVVITHPFSISVAISRRHYCVLTQQRRLPESSNRGWENKLAVNHSILNGNSPLPTYFVRMLRAERQKARQVHGDVARISNRLLKWFTYDCVLISKDK